MLLQVGLLDMDKAKAKHINGCLTLLQHNVSHQGLVYPIRRFHVEKQHFAKHRLKSLDTYLDRAANRSGNKLLCGYLTLNLTNDPQITKPRLPSLWEDHECRACVDQGIAFERLVWIEHIRNAYPCDDSSHIVYHSIACLPNHQTHRLLNIPDFARIRNLKMPITPLDVSRREVDH